MVGIMPDRPDRHSQGSTIAATDGAPFRNRTYANGPRDAASACRLGEAVGGGDQGAVRSPQRDNVSVGRRCSFVEPPRQGFVQMPEDHLRILLPGPRPLLRVTRYSVSMPEEPQPVIPPQVS